MWKHRAASVLAAILAVGGLSAAAAASGEPAAADYTAQIPAFVNQVSVWKPKSKASYAYTDLDQNGSLEILTSHTSKKGVVTNGLYELRDGRLTEVELPWGEADNETELKEKEVPVYYDAEEDIYYYVFGASAPDEGDTAPAEDAEPAAPAVVWLKDGVLYAEVLEEDAAARFAGMEAMTAAFGWISTEEHSLNDAPLEQLTELAGESVSGFKLTAGANASAEPSGEASA